MTFDITQAYIQAPLTPRFIWYTYCDDIVIIDTHTNTYLCFDLRSLIQEEYNRIALAIQDGSSS